jgi:NAD(P)-dependent dehydrogenase (short-subunit alcohol dehydrogenase family)
LKHSAPARVVTVCSDAQAQGRIDFDDPQRERSYSGTRTYGRSKLANVLFTYELARRIQGTGVTANAVEPGFVKTNLKVPFPFSIFSFMRGSAADGARPTVFLTSSAEVDGVSGKFFNKNGVATNSSRASNDEGVARRLWQVSAELTHLDAEQHA